MMTFTRITNSQQTYTASGSVEAECNGIGFLNTGNDTATILGNPLQPGQGWEPPNQFPGMWDETMYEVSFAGVGDNPRLLVIRQFIAK